MALGKFGRFEVQSLLGEGAMGAVYSAYDPMLDREVAIKVVRFPDNIEPALLEKTKQNLLREAQLAARLSHPGIVQVYDAGEQDGQPYIVLEKIRGHLLSDLIGEKGTLGPETADPIFGQLLEAMSYAHENGIVHLDLKPANIMIGETRQPRIMDFGIARSVSDLRDQDAEIRGTPRYMAPEQIMGGSLDQRADVFSLGVIFYQMLSGQLPFHSENLQELVLAITRQPHRPLQNFQGDLPRAYYAFVDRALSKSPADRFESAAAMSDSFMQDLRKGSDGEGANGKEAMTEGARQEILRFIQQRIKRKGDFPSVSKYVSEVVRAARSPDSSAQSIAQSILKDVSLTNKVLRVANSAFYRTHGPAITTISRAVVVLGMETILNMTSALGIFEHFLKGSDVEELKKQVVRSLFTALNAREVARHIGLENAEEPFICGILHHLGRLIVSFYFPEEQKAIDKLIESEGLTEEKASRKIMRLSYTELSQAISESWNMPKLLQAGLEIMDPAKHKGPLRGKEQRLQGVTSYACELSKATMIADPGERRLAIQNLVRKFEGKINLKPKLLETIVKDTLKNASGFSKTIRTSLMELGLQPEKEPAAKQESAGRGAGRTTSRTSVPARTGSKKPSEIDETLPLSEVGDTQPLASGAASGTAAQSSAGSTGDRPGLSDTISENSDYTVERQEFLTKIIADIAMTLTGAFSISDIIMMVLEGMFRGLGMQNVFLAMTTPKRDQLQYRFGLGPQTDRLRSEFKCRLVPAKNALAMAVRTRKEVALVDVETDQRRHLIPKHLLDILEPRSIVFVPLVVKNTAIGLFAAVRSKEQPVITELDLQRVRMLVSQCVLALHQSAANDKPRPFQLKKF